MRHFVIGLILLGLAPAYGQTRTLTLQEALELAQKNSRDLASARARMEQAAAGVNQAWAALLPNAITNLRYTRNWREISLDLAAQNQGLFALVDILKATSGNPVQNGLLNVYQMEAAKLTGEPIILQRLHQVDFTVAVTLPLVVPWAYPALQAAKRNVLASQANYGVTEAQILLGVAQAFFAAAGAESLVAARQHAIQVAKQTVDNAQARLEAGVVNRVEVTRAQLALLRAQQAARETEDLRVQTNRVLATLILLREPFTVVTGGDPAPPSEGPRELVDSALKLRPEFAALERTVDALSLQATSAAWRWAPTISAFGNLRAFNYAGFAGDPYAWGVGLQLDWILYDGGARDAARKLANAQRKENELRLLQLRDTIADDVEVARRTLETKRQALATARELVKLSKDALDLVRVQHAAGTATQLDLLQAQDALVGAEVAVAQSRFDLDLSTLQLKQKAGLFPGTYK
jgi:outer membrane protein TolC